MSVDHLGIRVRTRKMPGEPGVKTPARRRGLPPNQRLASSLVAARLGDSLFLSVAPLALSETHRLTEHGTQTVATCVVEPGPFGTPMS